MIQCKITVLKRTFNKELVEQYIREDQQKDHGPCDIFQEGQEFITDVFTDVPPGFCPWAWNDIYKDLLAFAAGGNWGMAYQDENVIIACCTDGTRPVLFKIEKIVT